MKDFTDEPVAHIAEDGTPHLLKDHLKKVAKRAAGYAKPFRSEAAAYAAGLWHDLGKHSSEFQKRIREHNGIDAHIEDVLQKQKDHSTAGALYAAQKLGELGTPIAFCIAGHHSGLADCPQLVERLQEKGKTGNNHLEFALRNNPLPELLAIPAKIEFDEHSVLGVELRTRMLFSCLVDADFLDTESFYRPEVAKERDQTWEMRSLKDQLDVQLVAISKGAKKTAVNQARAEILSACRQASQLSPGIFALNVPTGGGKTLAGMAFGLDHCVAHDKRRVVVAIPFTSIIEQNAKVYRDIFSSGAVLEHHSAFEPAPGKENWKNRLVSENWDAPIVVTTTVQLFESLLANRTQACRKLHRLADSVIILDEVQSLPPAMLTTILDVLQRLVDSYGVTVVLCTATQPALVRSDILPEGLKDVREVISGLNLSALDRVCVNWPENVNQTVPYETIADEVFEHEDVLAIVHTRADAQKLTQLLDERAESEDTIHLSALMCPEHRSEVLAEIYRRKREGESIRVVATQLVEAGVDLDFPVVFRALAGLDALAQAAGRCNREGKLAGKGQLHVFVPPSRPPPGVPLMAKDIVQGLLRNSPDLELFDPANQRLFFEKLYSLSERDKNEVQKSREALLYRQTAKDFRIIDNDWAAPIVVPWGKGKRFINELRHQGLTRGGLRKVKSHFMCKRGQLQMA